MCRTWKPASEWFLSITQVSARRGDAASTAATAARDSLRIIFSLLECGAAGGVGRGRPGRARSAQDAQDVILLERDAVGVHHRGQGAAKQVGRAHEGDRGLLRARGERPRLPDLLLDGAAGHGANVKA